MIPRPKSKPKELSSPLQGYYLDPFWVGGLAVLCALLGGLLWGMGLGLEGEQLEFSLYLTLGTIFPALLLAFSLPTRFSGFAPTLAQALRLAFAVLLVVASFLFVLAQHQYYALAAAATHLLLMYVLRRRVGPATGPAPVAMILFVVVVSWTAAAQFLWWSPYDIPFSDLATFDTWFFDSTFDAWFSDSTFDAWFLDRKYRILVFFLSLLLVFASLYRGAPEGGNPPRFRFRSVPNIAAVLVFGVASVRSDQLFNLLSYQHWGFFIGPAEMVRQGGWLLWDVPSWYGFLSTLTIAFSPFGSVWQSLYAVNSLVLFLSAVFLFFVLRSLGAGFSNFCFSLAVTLAAVFLLPGWAPELLGPQIGPSQGAFRFLWLYALLAILIWEYRTGSEDPQKRVLLAGCAAWLAGTLWSAESAAYCAAVWLPAYALLVFRKAANARAERGSLKSGLRIAIPWLLVPPLLLSSAVGAITAYYVLNLGHPPDWGAFFELSVSFGSAGFAAVPVDLSGPVLTLFLVFCALSATAVYFLRGGLMKRELALIAGTWGALWVTSSYFVPRSYPTSISALSPILCVTIGVTLYLLARHRETGGLATLVRASFVPVLTVMLTASFGNVAGLAQYIPAYAGYERETDGFLSETLPELPSGTLAVGETKHAGYERDINSRLPVMDESLLALLDEAQVKIDDPIVYADDTQNILPAWPVGDGDGGTRFSSPPRTWLPTLPFALFVPLPNERKELYISRFTERARLNGWLVQKKEGAAYTSSPWFSDQLGRTHTPTEVFENDDWRLTWFEFSE